MAACLSSGWSINLPAVLASGVSLGLFALIFWILRQRQFPGRDWFVCVNAGMVWWLAAAAFEIAAVDPACKIVGASLAWPGIAAVPTFWAGFLSRYVSSNDERLGAGRVLLALVVPAFALAAAFSNEAHGLLYGPGTAPVSDAPGAPIVYEHGPLFFALAAYLYVILAFGLFVVGRAALAASGPHRRHFNGFLLITAAPIVANLSYIVGGATVFGFDPTPFSFAITLAIFAWMVVGDGLFDLVPVAHRRLLAMLPDPVIVVDEAGRVVSANSAALALAGVSTEPVGAPLALLPIAGPTLAARLAASSGTGEHDMIAFGDPPRSFDLQVVVIGRGEGAATLGRMLYLRDVTRLEQIAGDLRRSLDMSRERLSTITDLHRRLQRQAARDPLTDLHNRRHLDEYLRDLSREAGDRMSVAMIDLDAFKALNDAHGHLVGDDVLRIFAARLTEAAGREGLAFRLGGEEFLLAAPGCEAAVVVGRLEALRASLRADPPMTRAGALSVTFSAGIAASPDDGAAPDALLDVADTRLYAAKRAGRDRIVTRDARLPRPGARGGAGAS